MIELYYWPTPNGRKVAIMLEECGLDYEVRRIDLGAGEQFSDEFLAISPNHRMPAIRDQSTGITLFESGAILHYLGEKSGRFFGADIRARHEILQWLFWQAAGQGPMMGELSHYVNYASDELAYPLQRYRNETDRLLGVIERRLADREYLAGELSVADFACFPWLATYRYFGLELDRFAAVRRWFDTLKTRPTLRRGMDLGKDWQSRASQDEARANLFGQTAATAADRKPT